MIRAYDESYIEDFCETFGEAVDYAVHDCHISSDTFTLWLINSGVAAEIEAGNPRFIAGMSGFELAETVFIRTLRTYSRIAPSFAFSRSREYWSGWALAYYQWFRNISFDRLKRCGITFSVIEDMYILHEADRTKLIRVLDEKVMASAQKGRALAYYRKLAHLTQKDLARESGVPLRMIQLYEQGRNDLSKANVSYIYALSEALHCPAAELVGYSIKQ